MLQIQWLPLKKLYRLSTFHAFKIKKKKLNNLLLLCYLHWLASTATKRHVTHKYRGQTWMHAALLSFSALVFIPFDPHFVLQTKQYKYIYKVSALIETESGTNFFLIFFLGWVQMVIFLKRVVYLLIPMLESSFARLCVWSTRRPIGKDIPSITYYLHELKIH